VNRRAFMAGLGAVLAAPFAAGAQQPGKIYRVAFLTVLSGPDLVDALREGLREHGWREGQNFVLEERQSNSDENVSALADELARSNVDVIVITANGIPYLGHAAANIPVCSALAMIRSAQDTWPVLPGRGAT